MDGREGLDESGDVDESEDRDALVFIVMEFEVAQDCSLTCEKTSKNDAPNEPKEDSNLEPKSSKMKRSWKHLVSRVAPKWPLELLQDRCWKGFGTILGPCSSLILTSVS